MKSFDPNKDYYSILGVTQDATQEEIDRAFRSRARTHHPDSGGSEEEMKALNEARDALGDREARRKYDRERRPPRPACCSSMAFDPDAATKAGSLKIPVRDGDFTGLCIGAAACFLLGLPFLALIETQWVFFLWPLRLMTIGALMIGTLMAHSALRLNQRSRRENKTDYGKGLIALQEIGFWIAAAGLSVVVAMLIYLT
jgi:hypothetical protein